MKQSKFWSILLCSLIFFSCNKEQKELQKQKRREEYKKEMVQNLNKDFNYYCLIIASKTNFQLDEVKPVLREYFIFKKGSVFNNNSFDVIADGSYKTKEIHNLDLMLQTSNKTGIAFKDIVKIYSELETSERINDLDNDVYNLSSTIEDLQTEIEK